MNGKNAKNTNKDRKPTKTYQRSRQNQAAAKSGTSDTGISNFTKSGYGKSRFFPESSMAMQAMGNPVSCPGQDNFIEDWNTVFVQDAPVASAPKVVASSVHSKRIPNAMCLGLVPYFGALSSMTDYGPTSDPLQMAAVGIKQFIDTSFGTITSYDSQDLMLYLLAVEACFPWIAEIKRDLRLALTYQADTYPKYVPWGLFSLLKISDFSGNYENGEGAEYTAKMLRGWVDEFNQLLFMFNKLPIPPEIGAFRYNDDFYDYIYMDSDDPVTAQLYVFKTNVLWTYEEHAEPYPILKPNNVNRAMTVGNKIELLRTMIYKLTALQTSSTAMIQNLWNAYGSKDSIKIETLDPHSMTPMEFRKDDMMLTTINNIAIFPTDTVYISSIVANPVYNGCEGHLMYIGGDWNRTIVNYPLQFHKPFKDVTKDEIGAALRLHPSLRVFKTWTDRPGTGEQTTQTGLTADGYTGFAFVQTCEIATRDDRGTYYITTVDPSVNGWMFMSMDFSASPIAAQSSVSGNTLNLTAYMARRDVEVTYRLEDLRMYWTYLTCELYGSDINRNFTGSRMKG